MASNYMRRF